MFAPEVAGVQDDRLVSGYPEGGAEAGRAAERPHHRQVGPVRQEDESLRRHAEIAGHGQHRLGDRRDDVEPAQEPALRPLERRTAGGRQQAQPHGHVHLVVLDVEPAAAAAEARRQQRPRRAHQRRRDHEDEVRPPGGAAEHDRQARGGEARVVREPPHAGRHRRDPRGAAQHGHAVGALAPVPEAGIARPPAPLRVVRVGRDHAHVPAAPGEPLGEVTRVRRRAQDLRGVVDAGDEETRPSLLVGSLSAGPHEAARGLAVGNHARREIREDGAPCPDDGAVADRYAWRHEDVGGDPHLVTDVDGCRRDVEARSRVVVRAGAHVGLLRNDRVGSRCVSARGSTARRRRRSNCGRRSTSSMGRSPSQWDESGHHAPPWRRTVEAADASPPVHDLRREAKEQRLDQPPRLHQPRRTATETLRQPEEIQVLILHGLSLLLTHATIGCHPPSRPPSAAPRMPGIASQSRGC